MTTIMQHTPYLDNANKFTVVVNQTIPFSRLANAIGHCCAGLAERIGTDAEFLDYPSLAGGWHARISRWPIVILAAKNSGQLARFVRETKEHELPLNCLTAAMIGESAAAQIRQTQEDTALEYWTVAAFGNGDTLRVLTRRFSMFKGSNEK